MEDYEKTLAGEAGLIPCGIDTEGEQMFMGTKQQWEEFERLSATKE